ncbi:MAG: lipid-transfer protein [Myxococcales bacterium]|nr:lipid-transfer protein [Myxococcales bacterium]
MPTTLRNEAAIAGIGQTDFSKQSNRSELQLSCEAVAKAIDDCGIDPKDIDGMVSFTLDSTDDIEVARSVGLGNLRFFSRVPHGGGAATGTIHHAAMAVATGQAKAVVSYRGLNGRSGRRYSAGVSEAVMTSDIIHWSWYMSWGLYTPASWVAMYTRRYMHEYGATIEDLGRIAVSTRNYAVNNPDAFFHGKPLTLEEHANSRWIVEPLHLYDCCQETDGGTACIITSVERAKDLKQKPAVIRGVTQGTWEDQEGMTSFYREDLTRVPELQWIADRLWAESGVGPKDMQAAVIYDAFTPIVLFQLEEFGFCGRGEAADFVRAGNLDIGGSLPTNTNGGQLSEAYIHGMNGVNEGVRLVRGTSVNQPKDVEHVLVTSGVGVPSSAMVLGKL